MNKTLVGIVTLGLGTLGLNALQDEPVNHVSSSNTVITEQKVITPTVNRYQKVDAKIPPEETKKPVIYQPIQREEISNGNCDPNYSGCVPIASDVDCASGKGNGPAYVSGPVRVIGSDIYGLDRDHDGIGCE